MTQKWSEEQKGLIINLIKALAILQQLYRHKDRWNRIYANDEDWAVALMLYQAELPVKQPKTLLQAPERKFYIKLLEKYGDERFTSRQAMFIGRLSKTESYRKLQRLWSKGFVSIDKSKPTFYYQIIRFPYQFYPSTEEK